MDEKQKDLEVRDVRNFILHSLNKYSDDLKNLYEESIGKLYAEVQSMSKKVFCSEGFEEGYKKCLSDLKKMPVYTTSGENKLDIKVDYTYACLRHPDDSGYALIVNIDEPKFEWSVCKETAKASEGGRAAVKQVEVVGVFTEECQAISFTEYLEKTNNSNNVSYFHYKNSKRDI